MSREAIRDFCRAIYWPEFRGRGDEVRIYPLSFSEFYLRFQRDENRSVERIQSLWRNAANRWATQTGAKRRIFSKIYLKKKKVYLDDIISRNNLRGDNIMDILVNILASSVGSNTNPNKLANTRLSAMDIKAYQTRPLQLISIVLSTPSWFQRQVATMLKGKNIFRLQANTTIVMSDLEMQDWNFVSMR